MACPSSSKEPSEPIGGAEPVQLLPFGSVASGI